jgi:CO/xanthine dehydrogenase Mo-binding subunit
VRQVGIGVPRVDALEKVLGEARYGADLSAREPIHLKVVRSIKPHAKIVRIELNSVGWLRESEMNKSQADFIESQGEKGQVK